MEWDKWLYILHVVYLDGVYGLGVAKWDPTFNLSCFFFFFFMFSFLFLYPSFIYRCRYKGMCVERYIYIFIQGWWWFFFFGEGNILILRPHSHFRRQDDTNTGVAFLFFFLLYFLSFFFPSSPVTVFGGENCSRDFYTRRWRRKRAIEKSK